MMSQSNSQSCDTNEYVIVEFPDEKSEETNTTPMALISSKWIYENKGILGCYWPLYLKSTTQREKAVVNHTDLRYEKCQKCPIIIKYSTDDYNKAALKLRKLEVDSDCQSSDTFERTRRNTQINDFHYSYQDDTDDDGPPTPPSLPKSHTISSKKIYTTLNNMSQKNTAEVADPILKDCSKGIAVSNVPHKYTEIPTAPSPKETFIGNTFTNISNQNGNYSVSNSHNLERCVNCSKTANILNTLVRDIKALREDMKHLLRLNGEKENIEIEEGHIQFSSYEDLEEFNKKLDDGEIFKRALSKYGLIGGKDCGDNTRRILSLLIHHKLACHMNWSGRNEKKSLESLHKVVDLICDAVRRNPLNKNASRSEIATSIKNWLRNSSDRDGGRSRRRHTEEPH